MYRHTQTGSFGLIIWPLVAFELGMAWYVSDHLWIAVLLICTASVSAIIALAFRTLTIQDEGDFVGICYGPQPLVYKRIAYDQIDRAERSRSRWIDGWGVHWVPGRGWTYNIWGFDCVTLTMGKRTVRVGSDDAESLLAMISEKIASD
jgi:hypothetical protein